MQKKGIILEAVNVNKNYGDFLVLKNINFKVNSGEIVAIVGKSGSGKTTLISVLSGLEKFTDGEIFFENKKISHNSEQEKNKILNAKIGFVYQFHHLLPEFNALENVMMPRLINNNSKKEATEHAYFWLNNVGLKERALHFPEALSGGERQRVAIARALSNNPKCVFLDEPTGNLDNQTANSIQKLINKISKKHASSFIVVTHDILWAKKMTKVFEIKNNKLKRRLFKKT